MIQPLPFVSCRRHTLAAHAGGNSELVTDALSRMLTSWSPLDLHMASDSISSTASADTIRHGLRQLSAHIPTDMSGFWANAANPCNPLDMPR